MGREGRGDEVTFLRAGPPLSISPRSVEKAADKRDEGTGWRSWHHLGPVWDEEGGELELDGDIGGEDGEKLTLDKEEDFVRSIVDPSLPGEDEVKKHYVMGHIP